jgi:hypothetical protein
LQMNFCVEIKLEILPHMTMFVNGPALPCERRMMEQILLS